MSDTVRLNVYNIMAIFMQIGGLKFKFSLILIYFFSVF